MISLEELCSDTEIQISNQSGEFTLSFNNFKEFNDSVANVHHYTQMSMKLCKDKDQRRYIKVLLNKHGDKETMNQTECGIDLTNIIYPNLVQESPVFEVNFKSVYLRSILEMAVKHEQNVEIEFLISKSQLKVTVPYFGAGFTLECTYRIPFETKENCPTSPLTINTKYCKKLG